MKKNKNIISRIFVYLLLVSTFYCFTNVLFGQVPKSEKEIPIYPGTKSNATKTSEQKSDMGWDMDKSLRKGILQIYDVDASPEDVFSFYLKKFGGREGSLDMDPKGLKPGTSSQVWYEIEYYEDKELTDYYIEQDEMHPGKWMKQKLTENRKQYKPGKWIIEAKFNWYYKEKNNDLTEFYIIIHDESFDYEGKKYKTSTEIQIQVTTRKSEIAMQEESEEKMDKQAEELSHSLKSKPPTEKDLGVPIYPGAKFNADASAGMSLDNDYKMYIYLTTDPLSKVVKFYEQKLKRKAEEPTKGHFLIPLKGKMPMPNEEISIEPNTMFGGKAKTVITIKKIIEKNK